MKNLVTTLGKIAGYVISLWLIIEVIDWMYYNTYWFDWLYRGRVLGMCGAEYVAITLLAALTVLTVKSVCTMIRKNVYGTEGIEEI